MREKIPAATSIPRTKAIDQRNSPTAIEIKPFPVEVHVTVTPDVVLRPPPLQGP
jgi:hypothetical protein